MQRTLHTDESGGSFELCSTAAQIICGTPNSGVVRDASRATLSLIWSACATWRVKVAQASLTLPSGLVCGEGRKQPQHRIRSSEGFYVACTRHSATGLKTRARAPLEVACRHCFVGVEDGRYWKTCRRLPQESSLPGFSLQGTLLKGTVCA